MTFYGSQKQLTPIFVFAAGLAACALPAWATEFAGTAVTVSQQANLSNGEGSQAMTQGMPVAMGDKIKTDSNGQVELIFTDDTKLVVGPNSQMVIEAYLLRSESQANNFTVRALGGSFRFITGKSEMQDFKIKTPSATIGVRGPSFDLSVGRATATNVIIFEGAADVCTQGGCVTIDQGCGFARAPRLDAARIIKDQRYRAGRINDEFRYIVSQDSLSERFRVRTESCNDVQKAGIIPPRTTASTGTRPTHTNDKDPETRDRPERSEPPDDPPNDPNL
ncbi:MAG TPA: FecR domain-containing protein [Afifellaceae bacterium]|nr:FecR domain-containing protein [Afifellaceae bacterium]